MTVSFCRAETLPLAIDAAPNLAAKPVEMRESKTLHFSPYLCGFINKPSAGTSPGLELEAVRWLPTKSLGMNWMEVEAASHPISAVLAAMLVIRRGGHWAGPAFLGLLLGWGSLPLILLLAREARPEPASGGQGFSPSEIAEGGSDWDEWRAYYYNLRQDLVVQVFLLLIVVLYVGLVGGLQLLPGLLGPLLTAIVFDHKIGTCFWVLSTFWPGLVGLFLLSGYSFPWLGLVWRYSDEIWRNSGLVVPAEVNWRHPGGPTLAQEEARVGLLEAVARSHRLHRLALLAWGLLIGLLAVAVAYTLLQQKLQHS